MTKSPSPRSYHDDPSHIYDFNYYLNKTFSYSVTSVCISSLTYSSSSILASFLSSFLAYYFYAPNEN